MDSDEEGGPAMVGDEWRSAVDLINLEGLLAIDINSRERLAFWLGAWTFCLFLQALTGEVVLNSSWRRSLSSL